jgi:hypothetical protein
MSLNPVSGFFKNIKRHGSLNGHKFHEVGGAERQFTQNFLEGCTSLLLLEYKNMNSVK